MFSKIDVNGPATSDLYAYMKKSKAFETENSKICKNGQVNDIPWNFAKFLLNQKGQVTHYFGPKVHPDEIL